MRLQEVRGAAASHVAGDESVALTPGKCRMKSSLITMGLPKCGRHISVPASTGLLCPGEAYEKAIQLCLKLKPWGFTSYTPQLTLHFVSKTSCLTFVTAFFS